MMRIWWAATLSLTALATSPASASDRTPTPMNIRDAQTRIVEILRKDWRSPTAEADDHDPSIINVPLRGDHMVSHQFDISELFPRIRSLQPKQADYEIAAYVTETWLNPSSVKYASHPYIQVLPETVLDEWRNRWTSETNDSFPVFDRLTNDLIVSYENRVGSYYLWGPIRNGDLLEISRAELVRRARQNLEDLAKDLVISPSEDGIHVVGRKSDEPWQSPSETILNDADNLILSERLAHQATRQFPGGYYLAMPEPARVYIVDANLPGGKAKLRAKMDQLKQEAESRFKQSTKKPTCADVNLQRESMQKMAEEFIRKNGSVASSRPFKRLSESECEKLWNDTDRWRPKTFSYPQLSKHIYEMRDGKLIQSD